MDKSGFFYTGQSAFAHFSPDGTIHLPQGMLPFAPQSPQPIPYDCGRCHATGWKDFTYQENDDRNRNHQDNQPGMLGTFDETGIQCEVCHGAGYEHMKLPSASNITKLAEPRSTMSLKSETMAYGEPVACIECHSVDGERAYPDYRSPFNVAFNNTQAGGRIPTNHPSGGARKASDGLLGIEPDTGIAQGKKQKFSCAVCHDPHQSTRYRDKPGHETALKADCSDCHTMDFNERPGGAAIHELVAQCTDCHMPGASHLLKIDLSKTSSDPYHYSKDGEFRQPWLRPSDACQGCHPGDFEERANKIDSIH